MLLHSRNEVGTNFVSTFGFDNSAPSGYLITETGYLMLVKSFTDDLAWKVQRELVDTYFKARQEFEEKVVVTETVSQDIDDSELLIRAVEALSGCLDGNRSYVLNILRHIIPDIDQIEMPKKVKEVTTEIKIDGRKKIISCHIGRWV